MEKNGILVLAGSGEFTSAMEEIDRMLLSKIDNPLVAIIPTAAGAEEDVQKWIDNGIAHFEKLNTKVIGVKMYNREDTENPEILEQLSRANFFYFSGGDPGYLLDTLMNSQAWELILKKHLEGAILAGSSAGAMVLGQKVMARIYSFFRNGQLPTWENGLGVVDFAVIPHFDKIAQDFSAEHTQELKKNIPAEIKVIGIDEDTVYIKEDQKWLEMGKGKVHNPAF